MFGDSTEQDDITASIEDIFKYFQCPEILSPIANETRDETSTSTAPMVPATERLVEFTAMETISPTERVEAEPTPVEALGCIEADPVADTTARDTEVPEIEMVAIPAALDTTQPSVDQTDESTIQAKDVAPESVEEDFYDYSPASPPPQEQCSSAAPIIIPQHTRITTTEASTRSKATAAADHDSSLSLFNRLVKGYSHIKRTKLLNNISASLTVDESYKVASLRNSIETLCLPHTEWTSAAVTDCLEKMLKITWRPMLLAKALLEVIEDTTDTMCYDFTPPSPAMTRTHQKCLLLIVRIEREIPSFMNYVTHQLDRSLFQFSQPLRLPAVMNLTHLYIGLIDLEQPQDHSKVRLFIYKCLYYFTHKATPMIYAMLMAHPHALPHANSVDFEPDPLLRALVSVITNIRYTSASSTPTDSMHRKNETYNVLKRRYGYFAVQSFPIDCAVDYCVECIRCGRITNVDYALILLAKRQGCDWAMKSIVEKHLLPMLHTYVAIDAVNDHRICAILFTIASIVKTCPLETPIDYYLNIFATCLNATERTAIQEAAISAMCQLSRFGCAQIYQYISAWRPQHEVSAKVMAMLNTVVYQKSRNFWYTSKG